MEILRRCPAGDTSGLPEPLVKEISVLGVNWKESFQSPDARGCVRKQHIKGQPSGDPEVYRLAVIDWYSRKVLAPTLI